MTIQSWGEKAAEDLFQAVQGYVERGLKAVCDRGDNKLEALEKRIAALESQSQSQLSYEGVYSEGKAYGRGSIATHSGTVWYAKTATCSRPGTDDSWQLMVKSHR